MVFSFLSSNWGICTPQALSLASPLIMSLNQQFQQFPFRCSTQRDLSAFTAIINFDAINFYGPLTFYPLLTILAQLDPFNHHAITWGWSLQRNFISAVFPLPHSSLHSIEWIGLRNMALLTKFSGRPIPEKEGNGRHNKLLNAVVLIFFYLIYI